MNITPRIPLSFFLSFFRFIVAKFPPSQLLGVVQPSKPSHTLRIAVNGAFRLATMRESALVSRSIHGHNGNSRAALSRDSKSHRRVSGRHVMQVFVPQPALTPPSVHRGSWTIPLTTISAHPASLFKVNLTSCIEMRRTVTEMIGWQEG